jgi:amino acid permease
VHVSDDSLPTACTFSTPAPFGSQGLWSATIGPNTTWVVDTMIAVLCVACAVIYSGILGDVFTQLLSQSQILPQGWNTRGGNIVVITALALLPMSLIRNLSALAFTSVLGFSAIMYTVFFIVVRALDGSYKPGAKFVTDGALKLLPTFKKASLWNVDFSSLVLASNLGLAYVAHYNAPSFYRELENTSSSRFRKMVNASFALLVLLYVVTMVSGYSTFGDVCQGNILLNYHPDDWLATLGRLATGFSILFGFPLVATGARESLIGAASSLGRPFLGTDAWHVPLVVAILAFVTTISLTISDVSLVVGLTGAALGSFIVYICPALLYAKAIEKSRGRSSPDYKQARWNLLMVPFGVFTGALGVYMTLQEKLGK